MPKIILIVDDITDNIRILQSILKTENYIVRVATSGAKALQLAKVEPQPDLILLDIMMPEMNGYDVCRYLKEDHTTEQIPVIFVTAKGEVEDEAAGFDVGAVDFITKPVSAPIVLRRVATHLSLVKVDVLNALVHATVSMLGEAGHYHDADTGGHISRIAEYAHALAEAAGWSAEQTEMLRLAAPTHDTGKIGIPEFILKAPRKLEPDEWKLMMTHTQIGMDILSSSQNPVFIMAADIALSHHEKWDGSGYPNQLSGEAIPESARIIAIVDVFDALTSRRPYKEAWTIEDALIEIKNSVNTHFEPRLVDAFLQVEDKIRKIKEELEKDFIIP